MLSTLRFSRLPFTALGIAYTIAALLAFDSLMLNWRAAGQIEWLFVLLVPLYACFACLLFARSRWLIPTILILLAGNAGLWGYRMLAARSVLEAGLIIVALNAAAAWYVWARRRDLSDSRPQRAAFFLTLLLLAVMLYWAICGIY